MSPVFTLLGHTHVLTKFVRWLSRCFGWYSPQGMDLNVNWVEALTLGSYPRVEGLGKVRFSPWLRSQTYYYVQDRGLISACLSPSFPSLSLSIFLLSFCRYSFSVCLHLYPHFLVVSIIILIFCLSPSLSSASVSVFLIFWLSLSLSLFFVCLHLYLSR